MTTAPAPAAPGRQRAAREPDAAERVWAAMRRFVEANDRRDVVREALGLGSGAGRVKVLWLLEPGPLTLRELAEAHGVDAPYATLMVNKLEERGFVERSAHPDDRRRKLVHITPAGSEAAAFAREFHARPPEALASLSVAELAELDRLLAKLAELA